MEQELQRSANFALYPSTLKRLREYRSKNIKTWDVLFNELLDIAESKEE